MSVAGRQFASQSEARKVFIKSQSTTNFRHLLPVAKPPRQIVPKNRLDRKPEPVKPKDRIKWWNIVPGDQVRVMAEENARIREVKGVNKFTNRIFIEGDKKVRSRVPCRDILSEPFFSTAPHRTTEG